MNHEDLLQIHDANLVAQAALDRKYSQNPSPSTAERARYERRKERMESMRLSLYEHIAPPVTDRKSEFQIAIEDHLNHLEIVSDPLCRLAHDLRNKLGVIVGYAELLSANQQLETEVAEGLQRILIAGRQATTAINTSSCPSGIGQSRPK
jgi:signal transduction histidine kinase